MIEKLVRASRALAAYVLAGGVLSFAGWALDVRRLADWDNDGIAIQPNAAIAAAATGAALLLATYGRRRLATILGGLAAAIGGTALFEQLTGADLGIDSLLLFARTWGRVGVVVPGLMGPPGAVSWLLLGTAAVLAVRGRRARAAVPILAVTTLLVASVSLIGYLYGARYLYTLPRATAIALQTATLIASSSLALLFVVPERSPVRNLIDDGVAGALIRRAVPILVVIPIAIGYMRTRGDLAGLYDREFGTALRTVAEILLLMALLWWTTRTIGRQARVAADSQRDSRHRLQSDLNAMTRLQALSTHLVSNEDREDLLRRILTVAAELSGAGRGTIQILDPDRQRLRIVAQQGHGDAFLEGSAGGDCERLSGTGAARVIVEDLALDLRLAGTGDADALAREGVRALIFTPLVGRDGRRLGALSVHYRLPTRPPDHVLRYLDLLSRMSADVIERSLIEQALRESERTARASRAEAERANALKDEFLATLSHELRSPLNAIMGWVRILEKRPSDPALVNEGIEVITRNAKAQNDLISDLLDMNRIVSGKIRLEPRDVRLTEVVSEALDTTRPAAGAKRIDLTLTTSPGGDAVHGDPGRLRQVVCNLLSNAIKFTPDGGRIDVELTRDGRYARIRVRDTGQGIGADLLPHVFDRFRQGDVSTTRSHGGLGLGLAIVKQLVELHGGSVCAESAGANAGATFTVSLPLSREVVPATPRSVQEDDESVRLDGVTVLVIEDQPDSRGLLRLVLERGHATVVTARSADEALPLVAREKPDIILCDVGMPDKDGYDFIAELRRRDDATPALAVTAFARTEDKIRALAAGFHAHVAKPVEPAELLATVATFLKLERWGRENA